MFLKRNLGTADTGNVTFAVLMLCTSMLICTTTLVAISKIQLQIEVNRGLHQVVYAAAKGHALLTVQKLQQGKTPCSETIYVGQTLVHSDVLDGRIVSDFVNASYMGASETIFFSYDTISKKLLDWRDNGTIELKA